MSDNENSPARRSRPRPAGAVVVAAALAVLVVSVLPLGPGAPDVAAATRSAPSALTGARTTPSVSPGLPQATVGISASGTLITVPRSFLGISTEYWTIPVWAHHLPLLGRVLATLTPHGSMVLRIGGSSADQTFWSPTKELPEWAFDIRQSWLRHVRQIVNRFGVRVILDLNLVTATPQSAVRWARAAEKALPPGSIVGFAIGNEPDIYSQASWGRVTGGEAPRDLPRQMTAAGYARSFRTYARALARVDRGAPLLGPALSDPAHNMSWITQLLGGRHPRLGAITVHRYPLSACAAPGTKTFPTIARVLSERTTAGMAHSITASVTAARRAGLPLRLTELNSVTCGGRKGVSNTFATALWAPDALFELLHAGARSVAVHVRADAINMAFSLTHHGLVAYPLLYGLSLFSRTIGGRDPQLVPLRLSARPSLRLKAWAVRVNGGVLHVLLLDKSSHPARVSLQIPGASHVSAQRLLARSARATSGVTLGGQHLNARGRWTGKATSVVIHPGALGYQVTVRGTSATLVTAVLRPGSLTTTHHR